VPICLIKIKYITIHVEKVASPITAMHSASPSSQHIHPPTCPNQFKLSFLIIKLTRKNAYLIT